MKAHRKMISSRGKDKILMKRWIVGILSIVMTASLAACGEPQAGSSLEPPINNMEGASSISADLTEKKESAISDDNKTELANPFVTYQTKEEAEKAAGFSLTVPDSASGLERSAFRAMKDTLIEALYQQDENQVRVRKGAGNQETSGVYGEFEEVTSVLVGEQKVEMKGNNGKIQVAVWTTDQYSYSVSASFHGEGIDSETMLEIIAAVE